MAKARRPRIRPRSSFTPIAATPPAARPKTSGPRRRLRGAAAEADVAESATGGVSASVTVTSSAGRSVIVVPLCRFRRLALAGRDLEEELLEVARGSREGDHRKA